jgi:hypothetical protein
MHVVFDILQHIISVEHFVNERLVLGLCGNQWNVNVLVLNVRRAALKPHKKPGKV